MGNFTGKETASDVTRLFVVQFGILFPCLFCSDPHVHSLSLLFYCGHLNGLFLQENSRSRPSKPVSTQAGGVLSPASHIQGEQYPMHVSVNGTCTITSLDFTIMPASPRFRTTCEGQSHLAISVDQHSYNLRDGRCSGLGYPHDGWEVVICWEVKLEGVQT
jgi:hypothetical protein